MVGKTSISKRFITRKFVKIDISNRTINTNIFQKCIEVNDKSFNLNIWDTAGEEKYHALGPIFYRGAHGAVVIFDVRNRQTFERATRWFHELSEFAEGNPSMILVGNKIDLPDRTITKEEAVDLANKYNCKFLEVSAFLGTNVNEIFNEIALIAHNEVIINRTRSFHLNNQIIDELSKSGNNDKSGSCCK